jgi:hypothetical protein
MGCECAEIMMLGSPVVEGCATELLDDSIILSKVLRSVASTGGLLLSMKT